MSKIQLELSLDEQRALLELLSRTRLEGKEAIGYIKLVQKIQGIGQPEISEPKEIKE